MTMIQRWLAGFALLALMLFAAERWGAHKVQAKWNIEKAERTAVAKAEEERNKKSLDALNDKFKKEIANAKSEASRRAVAAWLKSHGLLPDGTPVRGAGCETKVPQGVDGTPSESGAVERFADNCIRDARKVEMCTEWAVREGLETD